MTHELHLGTTESSRNNGLALAAYEQKETECDEEEASMLVRRFDKFFRNNRYANQRNNREKKPSNTKFDYGCHWCGSTNHFIKGCPTWKIEKGKENRKTTDKRKS